MSGADQFDGDLAGVSRALRAEYLDAREMEEEATEHLARKEADLVDVVLEAMQRGQPLRVRIGTSQFAGSVVHVAEDLAVIDDAAGAAQVDIRLSALDELWILDPVPGTGRGRRAEVPASWDDCLEGLEATGRVVELGGPRLPPARCRVLVAARDHLVLAGGAAQRVVPRAAVGVIVRRA
jgi:hypothetical protein